MKNPLILRLLALGSVFIQTSGSGPPDPGGSGPGGSGPGGSGQGGSGPGGSGLGPPPPVLSGPGLAFLGFRVVLRCSAPGWTPPLSYQLWRGPPDRGREGEGQGGRSLVASSREGEGRPASFPLKVTKGSDGTYHCSVGNSSLSNLLQLSVVTPASQVEVSSSPSPAVLFQGSRLLLSCDAQRGSHLSYTWFFNRRKVVAPSSSSRLLLLGGKQLLMESAAPEHSGNYSCVAWASVQDIQRFSSSNELQVAVKAYISKPQISFSVLKTSSGYRGNVSCVSSAGSPPVNMSLLVGGGEVGGEEEEEVGWVRLLEESPPSAWFLLDLVPGRRRGVARCRVTSDLQELLSEPLTLEVVPVGGEVKVEVEYLYTSESRPAAALLSCLVSRGSFPLYSWSSNGSSPFSPPSSPSSSSPSPSPSPSPSFSCSSYSSSSLLLLTPGETGFYRCRVRDSFDPTGLSVESQPTLVHHTEVQLSTTEKIVVCFCCFLLLTLALCAAALFSMLDHHPAQISLSHLDGFSLP